MHTCRHICLVPVYSTLDSMAPLPPSLTQKHWELGCWSIQSNSSSISPRAGKGGEKWDGGWSGAREHSIQIWTTLFPNVKLFPLTLSKEMASSPTNLSVFQMWTPPHKCWPPFWQSGQESEKAMSVAANMEVKRQRSPFRAWPQFPEAERGCKSSEAALSPVPQFCSQSCVHHEYPLTKVWDMRPSLFFKGLGLQWVVTTIQIGKQGWGAQEKTCDGVAW